MDNKLTEDLPVELRNLLEAAGYITESSKTTNDTDFQDIEGFAQYDLLNIIPEEDFEKY